jgi:hypothetical protein
MIQFVGDRPAFRVMCDVCGTEITDARMAMVRWQRPDRSDAVIDELVYCHKGKCDELANMSRDPWWELRDFVARLVISTGMADTIRGDIQSAKENS